MHDDHKHDQHIPPPDLPHEKHKGLFKPLHVIVGAIALIVILVIFLVMVGRSGY